MLFDKIVRIGYIRQMVKDISPNPIVVSQYNAHSLHYSGNDVSAGSDLNSEVSPSPCVHI